MKLLSGSGMTSRRSSASSCRLAALNVFLLLGLHSDAVEAGPENSAEPGAVVLGLDEQPPRDHFGEHLAVERPGRVQRTQVAGGEDTEPAGVSLPGELDRRPDGAPARFSCWVCIRMR